MKNLKLISTILLSAMLIFTISTAVFANNVTENDLWADVNVVEDNNTVENVTNDLENESLFENIEVENEVEEEEYNNLYTTKNSTTSNSENLADTGIGDSNGIMALIIVVSAVIAIYSAKKFNDYKNV